MNALRQLLAPEPFTLWMADLDAVDPVLDTLDAAERERAARFVFERDRRRYIAAHTVLRDVLAERVGTPAGDLRFGAGEFGKPYLVEAPRCAFNLSHSANFAVIALADDGEIGVDIEVLHTLPDRDDLVRQLFTANECALLEATPPAERDLAFLVGWTRKEACLKALGTGLSLEARAVDAGLYAEWSQLRVGAARLCVESMPPVLVQKAHLVIACARLLNHA